MGMLGYTRQARNVQKRYAAAQVNRLTSKFATTRRSSDAAIRPDLENLRSRARVLAEDNDYARQFLGLCVTNIIGPAGIRLQVRAADQDGREDPAANKVIEQAWADWSRKDNASVSGQYSWEAIQRLVVRTVARDGEALIRIVRGYPDNPWRFSLQMLEGDHLNVNHNHLLPNGNEIRMGVEFNKWSKPVAYHINVKHPGDTTYYWNAKPVQRVPADEIIHLFVPDRFNQARGVTWLHTAMLRLHNLEGYEQAELIAARIAASKMGFYTKDSEGLPDGGMPGASTQDVDGTFIDEVEPGTFAKLPPGWGFDTFDPNHPNSAFAVFVKATLRGLSSGLGVSYNALANDLEGVNYSSLRSGALQERDAWKILQAWQADSFHQIVYEEWLKMALLTGQVRLPLAKFDKWSRAARWQPRGWDWVDPTKDIGATLDAINGGLKTRAQALAERGQDLDDVLAQLAAEEKKIKAAGLKFTTSAKPTPPQPPSSEDGQEDPEDAEKEDA